MTAPLTRPHKKTGRPSGYRVAYCERVIELGKEGYSKAEVASDLDVHYNTLHYWMDHHPAFSEAMGRSQRESQSWWERQGRIHLVSKPEDSKINASLYSRSMAARFPNDWREKTEVKQDVSIAAKLTNSERTAKLSGLLDAGRARAAGRTTPKRSKKMDPDGGTTK